MYKHFQSEEVKLRVIFAKVPLKLYYPRTVSAQLRVAAAGARVAPLAAVDAIKALRAAARVPAGQVDTRGAVLTAEVGDIVEPYRRYCIYLHHGLLII